MLQRVFCVSVLWMLVCGQCRADDNAMKKELAKFEGTWTIVKMEVAGKSLLEKDKPEARLIIKDGKISSDAKEAPKGEKELELAKVLDPAMKPKAVTLPLEGNVKVYGIYEIDVDELRVCGEGVDTAQEKKPEERRPKEFDSSKGLLIVFKREKK